MQPEAPRGRFPQNKQFQLNLFHTQIKNKNKLSSLKKKVAALGKIKCANKGKGSIEFNKCANAWLVYRCVYSRRSQCCWELLLFYFSTSVLKKTPDRIIFFRMGLDQSTSWRWKVKNWVVANGKLGAAPVVTKSDLSTWNVMSRWMLFFWQRLSFFPHAFFLRWLWPTFLSGLKRRWNFSVWSRFLFVWKLLNSVLIDIAKKKNPHTHRIEATSCPPAEWIKNKV